MKSFEKKLEEEIKTLEIQVRDAERRLQTAPGGKLCVSSKRNRRECYLVEEGVKQYKRIYISEEKKELVSDLAQKEYDLKLVYTATKRMNGIKQFLKQYEETSLNKLYEKTHPYRREMIRDIVASDEEYVNRWQSSAYTKKEIQDMSKEIYSEKGEMVRSKSEKIIADKLYSLGIPYRYECQLKLAGNIIIYPDFTILKMPERKEVYLEHFGLLDDMDYVDNMLLKLNTFEKNGIYLGVDLFITHETGKHPLNSRALDGMLQEWFLCK